MKCCSLFNLLHCHINFNLHFRHMIFDAKFVITLERYCYFGLSRNDYFDRSALCICRSLIWPDGTTSFLLTNLACHLFLRRSSRMWLDGWPPHICAIGPGSMPTSKFIGHLEVELDAIWNTEVLFIQSTTKRWRWGASFSEHPLDGVWPPNYICSFSFCSRELSLRKLI